MSARSVRPLLRVLAEKIVTIGFRTLAARCHPDAGGDHEVMIELIQARDALRGPLGERA